MRLVDIVIEIFKTIEMCWLLFCLIVHTANHSGSRVVLHKTTETLRI